MKGSAVNWLIDQNTQRREDASVDIGFLTGLLISVFSVKFVKQHHVFDDGLVQFVKGALIYLNIA